ncbi:hypothetical protein HHI36_003275 [Cryptolaemus montrouzieri]|uniref:Microsomal glutathione S-transferase 1 n=1 Tax=Cryptolaemus montrouzieri TaxID=559131 RepID=A0ABD2PDD5_9CUCU
MDESEKILDLYLLTSSLLLLKMMVLIVLTITKRMSTKAFVSEEDAVYFNGEVKTDESVERIRRAVQNDLENVIPFIVIGYLYLATRPPVQLAYILFLTFLLARVLHSICYAVVVARQPMRAVCWGIGFFITGVMTVSIIIHCIIKFL